MGTGSRTGLARAPTQINDPKIQIVADWSLPASSSRYSRRVIPRSHAMWSSLTPSRSRSRGRCWTMMGSMLDPIETAGGPMRIRQGDEVDEYSTGEYRWWHLTGPGPELDEAVAGGWFPTGGRVLDLGCGAGSEAAWLSASGATVVGIDVSLSALSLAREQASDPTFVAADATLLPFAPSSFDAALDRGCFHYLSALVRASYVDELARVLRPESPFLLRACLTSTGVPNSIDAAVIRSCFSGWAIDGIRQRSIPSDTRPMPALVCRFRSPR